MTNDPFEVRLSAWLRDDAAHRVPEHLDAVLLRTVATPQRRWWSSPRRWLPVELPVSRLSQLPPMSLRTILVLAIVALLVAALLAVAGASRRHVPKPFGPARNGVFVTGINGDLFQVDPVTGTKTALVSDDPAAFDFGPAFSRDGTKLSFLRSPNGNGLALFVADPDGSHAVQVTPFVDGLDGADWSPDGSRIVYLSALAGRDGDGINVVNVDGSHRMTLDVGGPANQIAWLPPDGDLILFRRGHLVDGDPPAGIFTVHPDGTGLRQISSRPGVDRNDYQDVTVSPDGTRIAYRDVSLEQRFRIHILDLRTGFDSTVPEPAGATGEGGPAFSPDGRSIAYIRWRADNTMQLAVVPADGSGTGIAIGPRGSLGDDGPSINNYFFTPDGTAIVANDLATNLEWLLPIDGSPGTVIARGSAAYDSLTTVQRVAP
jgi:Tol biopolymer transport system component